MAGRTWSRHPRDWAKINVASRKVTRQSQRFVTALGERATPPLVDWTLYPNSGHGSGAFRGEAIGHLVDFVKQQLAG